MYTLKRSYIFDPVFSVWSRRDLSLFKISDIMNFHDFKLILVTDEDPDTEFAVMKETMEEYHSEFVGRFALSIWLSTFQEDTIARSDRPVKLPDIKYLESKELFRSGARLINVRVIGDDLELKCRRKEDQKYGLQYFRDNCLAVLNRRVYKFDEYLDDVYIYHGGERLKNDSDYAINFLDFSQLGGIGHTWLRKDQITDLTTEFETKNNKVKFRVVLDEPVTGKTPFVVIGGTLHLLDDTIFQADANTFIVTVDKERLVQSIFNDKDLGERLSYVCNANISGGGLRVDTLDIPEMMAHHTSFFGWVNFTNLLVSVEEIPQSNTPDEFRFYRYPKGMVHYDDGEIAHISIFDYNQHQCSIVVTNTVKKDWMLNHQSWDDTVAKTQTGSSTPFEMRSLYVRDIYWF